MKKLILAVFAISSLGHVAHAKCEAGMKTLLTCNSVPQPGDHNLPAAMVERIDICKKGKQLYIALEAEGTGEYVETTPIVRTGGTTYPISDIGEFTTSSGFLPNGDRKAKFTVYSGGHSEEEQHLSSTFGCPQK